MSAETVYKEAGGVFMRLVNTCISILKVVVLSKPANRIPKVKGGQCVVLGNGPSLKTSLQKYGEKFSALPLICVNSFSTTPEFERLKPSYYVILDYGFWQSEDPTLMNALNAIRSGTHWPMTLFVPQMASGSQRLRQLAADNKNVTLRYFNYTVFKGSSRIAHWFYKKDLAMPQSQNVLVAATFLGVNMGFDEVVIVGADHTWHEHLHVDENNILHLKHIHFYDEEQKVSYIPFRKGAHLQETFRMDEILVTWAKVFYGYIALEKYARSRGCKIYNASEVSFVDAFERKKLS